MIINFLWHNWVHQWTDETRRCPKGVNRASPLSTLYVHWNVSGSQKVRVSFIHSEEFAPPFAAWWPVDQEMIAEVDMGENKVWRCTIPCGWDSTGQCDKGSPFSRCQWPYLFESTSGQHFVWFMYSGDPSFINIPNVSWSKLIFA